MNPSARRHHYAFAHTVLRDVAFASPERLLIAAINGSLDEELRSLWRLAERDLAPPERLPADGLTGRLVDHQSVLVTLPPAVHRPEAHMVLVTAPLGGPVRYAILEEALDTVGKPAAMLCLWSMTTQGPAHAATLQFIPATEEAFLEAARELPSSPPALAIPGVL